tara:strand:+ start:403 stop:984 length:582 start_codon:yes stop_codon:yes gene_type:complete
MTEEKKSENVKTEKKGFNEELEIPKGIDVKIDSGIVTVKGQKGEVKKDLFNKKVDLKVEGNKIMIASGRSTKREKKMIGSFRAHLNNLLKGVTEPYSYTLKVCSGHFPMTVSVNNNQFIVKNLLGEKIPRVLDLKEGVTVKVEGELVVVESPDKEKAGQCAASIEQLTRRNGYDTRIFQDGCWITMKGKKEIK